LLYIKEVIRNLINKGSTGPGDCGMGVDIYPPMKKNVEKRSWAAWIRISPWVIMGSLIVLVPIFIFMTMESIKTQRKNMILTLSEKGDTLIRSFEAGTRTGMMGVGWSGLNVQRLIMETAEPPGILYILITDKDGKIVAHNEPGNIGKLHEPELHKNTIGNTVQWRILKTAEGKPVFEVYRKFNPSQGRVLEFRHRKLSHDWFFPHMLPHMENPPVQTIFVGLNMEPIEQVIQENIKQKIIVAIILMMYGLLGIASIAIAQNYRSAKTSLSRIKAFSDTLVQNMPIGLIFISEKGALSALNDVSEKLLTITSRNAVGRKASEILPREIIKLINELKSPHDISSRDLPIPSQDKTMIFEASASILMDADGTFLGHIVLLRDITEIEDLKREVERKERLASIGSLAAGVAHEIRNPLSSIKGFATYFKERYRDTQEDQKIADIMIGEVERLNRVISQLLEFARPMDLRKESTSIADLVNRSLEMIEKQAAAKDISINRTGLSHNHRYIRIDSDKIGQVMLNVFLNAIEAMDEGGTLFVSIQNDEEHSKLHIRVSDTGHGIASEDIPHVFDPYFTTKQSGTGLGLAIVHKIIEAHEGDIRVESIQGQGTAILITLPTGGE
jgi:two-component system sensor histidine kinase HydH